jgi:hypothetical protein
VGPHLSGHSADGWSMNVAHNLGVQYRTQRGQSPHAHATTTSEPTRLRHTTIPTAITHTTQAPVPTHPGSCPPAAHQLLAGSPQAAQPTPQSSHVWLLDHSGSKLLLKIAPSRGAGLGSSQAPTKTPPARPKLYYASGTVITALTS